MNLAVLGNQRLAQMERDIDEQIDDPALGIEVNVYRDDWYDNQDRPEPTVSVKLGRCRVIFEFRISQFGFGSSDLPTRLGVYDNQQSTIFGKVRDKKYFKDRYIFQEVITRRCWRIDNEPSEQPGLGISIHVIRLAITPQGLPGGPAGVG